MKRFGIYLIALFGLAQPIVITEMARSQAAPPATQPAARPQLIRSLAAHDGEIYNFAFSPDSQKIITTGADRTVRIFQDLGVVQDVRIDSEVPNTWFSWVAVSPDGQTLVTSRSDGTIQLRDFGGTVRTTLPYPSRGAGRVAIAANNRTLIDATGFNGDFGIRLWDLTNQQQRSIGGNWATHTAITPDGYILVAGSSTGTATVWNLIRGRQIVTFPTGATEGMKAIAISPDGLRVYVAKQNRLEEWNARSGRLTRTLFQTSASAEIKAIAIHPDGQRLAISFGNYIQLRDLQTNRPIVNLAANSTGQQFLGFSPNGRFFANTDGASDRLRVWRL